MPAASLPQPQSIADPPTRIGQLLHLVRRLIDYGRELAATLQQQRGTTAELASVFGTLDIQRILACITRGLHRASALETGLAQGTARLEAIRRLPRDAGRRRPSAPPAAAQPAENAATQVVRLPTPAQFAAEIRRRPVGAVIADICRDFGILPSHPLWRELQLAIIRHDGNYAGLVMHIINRVCPLPDPDRPAPATPLATPRTHPGTGPP